MENQLYVNQLKSQEWGLSMGEALLFSFVVSPGEWVDRLPEDPRFIWMANSKLAEELPLVISHKGSARRHMASFEEKGLVERRVVGNRSYYRVTEKGQTWRKTSTPRANESVEQGERNGSAKANESVHQSSTPRSSAPNQKKETRAKRASPSPDQEREIVRLYREWLPKWPKVSADGWQDSEARRNLHARWRSDPRCRDPEFWPAFFSAAGTKEFWNTGGKDGGPIEAARLSWLLSPSKFRATVERGLELAA